MEEFKCSYLPNNNIKAWTIRLSPLLPFDSKEFEVYALGKRIYMIIDNYNQGTYLCVPSFKIGIDIVDKKDCYGNYALLKEYYPNVKTQDLITIVNAIAKIEY